MMEFFNPVYHSGLNTTVRLGLKWFTKCEPKDEIEIVRPGEDAYGSLARGEIIDVQVFVGIDKIPKGLLKKNHDPACRTKDGLYYVLRHRYHHGKYVDRRTMVLTVISFRI